MASVSRSLKLLPRKITVGTFNNHIVLSSMNIVLQLSELRLSTALSPPRKGGLLPNVVYTGSILGCAAGQDMVLVSVPKHGKLF